MQHVIQECAGDNRLAQEKLYRKFYTPLFLLCKRFFANDHDALECLNDGMVKVFKKIGGFQKEKGELFNWIYTIIRNTALDKLKNNRTVYIIEMNESFEPVFEEDFLETLEWKDIYKLLDVLTPATRVVCVLYYIEGFKIKEISEKLSLNTGTIKWHLSETRRNLKSVLKNYYF